MGSVEQRRRGKIGISWDFGFGGQDDPVLLKPASNLKGKLLLIYGPQRESNERMARALIDANRFFDALPVPGADHGLGGVDGVYVSEAVQRYFDEHLKPKPKEVVSPTLSN